MIKRAFTFFVLMPYLIIVGTLGLGILLPFCLLPFGETNIHTWLPFIIVMGWYAILPILILTKQADKILER